jgi:hypothetical protein
MQNNRCLYESEGKSPPKDCFMCGYENVCAISYQGESKKARFKRKLKTGAMLVIGLPIFLFKALTQHPRDINDIK